MNKREAQDLLPWFVAGSLSADESRAVRAFIDSGEITALELEELALFAETVNEQQLDEPAYNSAVLSNAISQLDATPQADESEPLLVMEPQVASSWWRVLTDRLQWALTPPVAKVALAAQFLLVVAMGAVLLVNPAQVDDLPGFETVAGAELVSTADLNLVLNPAITVAELQTLLRSVDAQIVSGPSALGMYGIDVQQDADIDAVQKTLTGHPAITFVQPVAK